MHIGIVLRILGVLLMLFSSTLFIPIIVSFVYEDGVLFSFLQSILISFFTGLILWLFFHKHSKELRLRDGFIITVSVWLVLGIFGALPFFLNSYVNISLIDSVFESISGLTTTGATIFVDIDYLPKSLLFYRQMLQWLGGMGIVLLAVAILPALGVGGMQLYRTEAPGTSDVKDNKLTPRIAQTAKALWYIYLGLTVLCALCYWIAGMSIFDAISHSFSTIAIGGFSTHDNSLGYFQSPLINIIAIVFMLISATNFSLHFFAWKRSQVKHYFSDPEFITFVTMLFGVSVITVLILFVNTNYSAAKAIEIGLFQVVSIFTTTGFTVTDINSWPNGLPYILLLTAFAGGCAGSTAGGMKVIRVLLLFKQALIEIKRLIHPHAIFSISLRGSPIPSRFAEAVWGFAAAYILIFLFLFCLLLFLNLDITTAWSAVVSCLNNLGPALGSISQTYASLSVAAKWVLCAAMLLGRLEVFTVLVLCNRLFWQR